MSVIVAIQGIAGSYHHLAAREYFHGEELELVECRSFPEVIASVRENPRLYGLMAIENTIAGGLLPNHERIRRSGLTVVGESKLRISHCLAALPGTTLDAIRQVDSHPMALMQCEAFLDSLKSVTLAEKEDTASSARNIAENALRHHAAICSREAAAIYGLELLAEEIETDKHNFTRFLVLADPEDTTRKIFDDDKNKASLVFSLPHVSGSLSQVLAILSFYGMNLTKIQSLPILGREWQYLFYVDLTFQDYLRYRKSLEAVIPLAENFQILGEYAEFRTESLDTD